MTPPSMLALNPVMDLYGMTPVSDFGPVALEAVMVHMIGLGWSRQYINRCCGFIRQCFKWGIRKELVPSSILERLRAVPGLQKGKTTAPDHPPRLHVKDELVEQTIPFLPGPVQGLVRFQQLTGCRPEEAILLQIDAIDKRAFVVDDIPVWVYIPEKHKNAWREQHRGIPIGPRCQEMLLPFLDRAALRLAAGHSPYCFNPRDCGRSREGHGDYYCGDSYGRAVARACARGHIEHWSPYQLRHGVATRVELDNSSAWERASLVLGHHDPDVIRVYAHGALQRAARIVAKFG